MCLSEILLFPDFGKSAIICSPSLAIHHTEEHCMITIASFLFCILNECFVFSIPINSLHYLSFDLGSESRAMLENFLSTPTTFLRVLISSIRFHSCFVLPLLLRVAGVNFGQSPVYNR